MKRMSFFLLVLATVLCQSVGFAQTNEVKFDENKFFSGPGDTVIDCSVRYYPTIYFPSEYKIISVAPSIKEADAGYNIYATFVVSGGGAVTYRFKLPWYIDQVSWKPIDPDTLREWSRRGKKVSPKWEDVPQENKLW